MSRMLVNVVTAGILIASLSSEAQAAAPPAVTGLQATTPFPGAVFLTWTPVPGATSYNIYRSHDPLLVFLPPFGIVLPPAATPMPGGSGVTSTTFPDVGLTQLSRYFYVVTAVNADGESSVTPVGSALHVRPSAPANAVISGFVDTHNHQFSNLSFGGRVLFGDAFGSDAEHALGLCNVVHGPGGILDIVGNVLHGRVGHFNGGWNAYDGWPRWNDSTHQQVYEDWLYRAFEGGLRLLVVHAVNNEILCRADSTVNFLSSPPYSCDDMASVDRQIDAAYAMQSHVDSVHGGPGRGWYRIVQSATQARAVINSGKLAVVLGIEVDSLFGCVSSASCTDDEVRASLQTYYDRGVRHLFPVHLFDNGFGGAAIFNPLFNYGNKITRGSFFTVEQCPDIAPGDTYAYKHQTTSIVSFFATLFSLGTPTANAFSSECNSRGLTPSGETLVNAMMDRGMIIDLDHMSVKTTNQVLQMAQARHYPGVVSGHGGPTSIAAGQLKSEGAKNPSVIAQIGALGGLVSPILAQGERQIPGTRNDGVIEAVGSTVPNDCSSSGKTFAQAYLDTVRILGGAATAAVGFGSDFNGLAGEPGPRFGTEQCTGDTGHLAAQTDAVPYPFAIHNPGGGYVGSLNKDALGTRQFDYNTQGLAHMGLVPDMLEDLKRSGVTDAQLAPLFRSAERYLHMWELAEANATPLPAITLAMNVPPPASGWYVTAPSAIATAVAAPGAPAVAGIEVSSTGAQVTAPSLVAASSASLLLTADGTTTVSATARDLLDRESAAPATVTARIDRTAPTIACDASDGLWHGANVWIACSAADATSGLLNAADAAFALATTVAAGQEVSNASTGTHTVHDVAGHATTAGPVSGYKIDLKAPSIALSLPATPVALGTSVVANYACTDGGSGVSVCSGSVANGSPLDTSSVGTRPFLVTAADAVNNQSSASGSYSVSFAVCLLYDPLKAHKSGSTIPIKLQICNASGGNVSSASVVLHALSLSKLSSTTTGPVEDAGQSNPDNDFRFDAGLSGYIFNLKTTGLTQGTWQMFFTATGDATEHAVRFQIR